MIEVQIPQRVLDKFDNPVTRGMHILNALRGAGVPVVGTLWPEGVESGSLSVDLDDLAFDGRVYKWTK